MTREEAAKWIREHHSIDMNVQHDEAMRTALKALEQGSILDRIRDEIWDLQYGPEEKSETDKYMADAYNNAIQQVIEILDKYNTRKEVEE